MINVVCDLVRNALIALLAAVGVGQDVAPGLDVRPLAETEMTLQRGSDPEWECFVILRTQVIPCWAYQDYSPHGLEGCRGS
jgi:hypothetical protein